MPCTGPKPRYKTHVETGSQVAREIKLNLIDNFLPLLARSLTEGSEFRLLMSISSSIIYRELMMSQEPFFDSS